MGLGLHISDCSKQLSVIVGSNALDMKGRMKVLSSLECKAIKGSTPLKLGQSFTIISLLSPYYLPFPCGFNPRP
jgi:hypothetical protein